MRLERILKGERLTGRAMPCRLLTGEGFLLICNGGNDYYSNPWDFFNNFFGYGG